MLKACCVLLLSIPFLIDKTNRRVLFLIISYVVPKYIQSNSCLWSIQFFNLFKQIHTPTEVWGWNGDRGNLEAEITYVEVDLVTVNFQPRQAEGVLGRT